MEAVEPTAMKRGSIAASSGMKQHMGQFPAPPARGGAVPKTAETEVRTRKQPAPPPLPLSAAATARSSTFRRRAAAEQPPQSFQQTQVPDPAAPSSDVAKLHKLLSGKHSHDLEERHDHAIRKVLKRRSEGYALDDLHALPAVLENLAARTKEQPTSTYASHLVSLLELLVKPIDFSSLNDQRDLQPAEGALAAVLATVTSLLAEAESAILATIIFVLDHLVAAQISAKRQRITTGGVARAWQDVEIRVVEGSRIAASLRRPLELMLGASGGAPRSTRTTNRTATSASTDASPQPTTAVCALDNDTQGRLLSAVWGCTTLAPQQQQLVQEGLVHTLCLVLGSPHCDVASQEGLLVVEALWNCMEGPSKAAVVRQLDSAKCTQALTDGLRAAFKAGDSRAVKQARNDLVALIALFTRQPSLRDNLVTGHTLEFMLRFACCGDVPTRHPDCRTLRLNNSEEDFEALKLLLTSVVPLLQEPSARDVVQASNLVPLCLRYLQFDAQTSDAVPVQPQPSPMKRRTAPPQPPARPRNWTDSQYDELQLLVLSLLPSLVPRVLPQLVEEDAAEHLVRMLRWAFTSGVDASRHHRTKKIQGAANSFLATQDFSVHRLGQGEVDPAVNNGKRVHALHIMKALEVILFTLSEEEQEQEERDEEEKREEHEHADQGKATTAGDEEQQKMHSGEKGSRHTRSRGDRSESSDSKRNSSLDIDMAATIDRESRKELQLQLLKAKLLEVALSYLSVFTPTMDDMLLILKTHAWQLCALLCSDRPRARREFHAHGGVDTLLVYLRLDLPTVCADEEHHNLLLAALDACWSCVVPCYLAREELLKKEGVYMLLDILEGSPASLHNIILGILTDLAEYKHVTKHLTHWSGQRCRSVVSLLVSLWEEECQRLGCTSMLPAASNDTFPLKGQRGEESAIQNVFSNLLGKIYSLLCLIGFEPAYEIARPKEKATLVVIEQYLNLKAGEVWREIEEELRRDGIQPVEHDEECLRLASLANQEMIEGIAERQREALEEEAQENKEEEQSAFQTLRQSVRLADALAQEEETFVRRTTTRLASSS